MLNCICEKKFIEKSGKIYGYQLTNIANNEKFYIYADKLREAIKAGAIIVMNLKLTAGNRIIENKNGIEVQKEYGNDNRKLIQAIKVLNLASDTEEEKGKYIRFCTEIFCKDAKIRYRDSEDVYSQFDNALGQLMFINGNYIEVAVKKWLSQNVVHLTHALRHERVLNVKQSNLYAAIKIISEHTSVFKYPLGMKKAIDIAINTLLKADIGALVKGDIIAKQLKRELRERKLEVTSNQFVDSMGAFVIEIVFDEEENEDKEIQIIIKTTDKTRALIRVNMDTNEGDDEEEFIEIPSKNNGIELSDNILRDCRSQEIFDKVSGIASKIRIIGMHRGG